MMSLSPLPSPSAIRGFCAGYFLWSVITGIPGIFRSFPSIPPGRDFWSLNLGLLALVSIVPLVLGVAGLVVGLRLLWDKDNAVVHALYVAWAQLFWCVVVLVRGIQMSFSFPEIRGVYSVVPGMLTLLILIFLLHRLHRFRRRDVPSEVLGAPNVSA